MLSSRFELQYDPIVTVRSDLVVFGNAHQSSIPTLPIYAGIECFDPFRTIPIPSTRPPLSAHNDLIILGRIKTHIPHVIAEQRVAHETRVVRVRPLVQPSRVRQVQIVTQFVHLHGRHGIVRTLIHAQPRVDVRICGPSAPFVTTLQHVHNMRECRIGYPKSQSIIHLVLNGAAYDILGIVQGDGNGHLQYSRCTQFTHDFVVSVSVLIGNDVQIVDAARCELRLHRFDIAVRAENLVGDVGGTSRHGPPVLVDDSDDQYGLGPGVSREGTLLMGQSTVWIGLNLDGTGGQSHHLLLLLLVDGGKFWLSRYQKFTAPIDLLFDFIIHLFGHADDGANGTHENSIIQRPSHLDLLIVSGMNGDGGAII
mmetsp:Transcript_26899/g.48821  ORF Transcript_26899/g.48821 Transcript_26899/m.48821 type:complete len:367 (-) Transcript_26899:852-1952(-)